MKNWITRLLVALVLLSLSPAAQACAACFGKNDGPLAKGMNAGIFTLLGIVGLVLAGFFVLMIYLVRRASVYSEAMVQQVEAIRMQNEAKAVTS
ncbi:MAG: hypothetical protein ACPGVU_09450 [Limisphaerales bacterium]